MKDNKMGSQPIPKLIMTMSLPMILAMLIQALYNVVDSIFVSRISTTNNDGLTAISLAFPLQLIVIAVFVGLGVGINSLISRKLGEKDLHSALAVAENGVVLGVIVYTLIAIVGSIFARPFMNLFTESQEVVNYGVTYIRIIMIFAFGRIFAHTGNSVLQGTGEMVVPMIAMLIGAVLNIALDPILIFGYFGFSAMGVKGAAIATVVAQILSMIYVWVMLLTGKFMIKFNIKNFKPDRKIIRQILLISIPVAIMQALNSIALTAFNLILSQFGDVAISVMGAYFRLQFLVLMPIYGFSNGTMPIIGYNFGAKNKKRMKEAIVFSISVALVFMIICLGVFQIYPEELLALYKPSESMTMIGVHAFRTISYIFPLMAVNVLLNTGFQAFGKAHYSLITSVIRQLLILLPVAILLSKSNNINMVWYAFLISEILGLLVVAMLFKTTYYKSTKGWDMLS